VTFDAHSAAPPTAAESMSSDVPLLCPAAQRPASTSAAGGAAAHYDCAGVLHSRLSLRERALFRGAKGDYTASKATICL